MNRREFLETGLGALVAAGFLGSTASAGSASGSTDIASPRSIKLTVQPVMTNMIHTGDRHPLDRSQFAR